MADQVDPDPPPPPPPAEVVVTTPTPPPAGPIPEVPADAPPPKEEGCFSKRTCLEKFFIILIVIIIIICLAFVGLFLVYYLFSKPPVETCLSEDCVTAGSRLRKYMDDSVDPCNNFYQYACGGWAKEQTLGVDDKVVNSVTRITDANRVHIKGILNGVEHKNDTEFKTKPRSFYQACMDTGLLTRLGSGPFQKLIDEVGSIPTLDQDWDESEFDLNEYLSKLFKFKVQPLFTTSLERDQQDINKYRIVIRDASLKFDKETYEKFSKGEASPVDHYKTWMTETLLLLGAEANTTEDDVDVVLTLQAKIAELMRFEVEKTGEDNMDNEMLIDDLNKDYDWLHTWHDFVKSLVPTAEITTQDPVIVTEPGFLKTLGELIAQTPRRDLANYVMYPLLSYTKFLDNKFVQLHDDYNKAVYNTEPKPRWERCAEETETVFPDFMSRMYIDMYFDKKTKKYMESMISDLRHAFLQLVNANQWLTSATKEKVKEKISRIKAQVAYPDYILDDKSLIAKYESISAKRTEYMQSWIDFMKFKAHRLANDYTKDTIDTDEWKEIYPITVNALYKTRDNQMVFPAAILQDPLFDLGYSYSMNYGSIGSIIGHEFAHSLGSEGRKYNPDGEKKKWWAQADVDTFEAQSECFINQYGCFKWDGYSIDGRITLEENIADNGGLKQAFRAYRNLIRRKGLEEQRLPGVADLDHNQLFFLSFAQAYCSKVREEYKEEITKQPHTPKKYRVYGAIKNSEEFAEAFKCREGSNMHPLAKCSVW